MKGSRLLVLGVLLVAIGVTGPAFGQGCNVILTSGLNPNGNTYQVGDTIEFTIFLQVPDGLGACQLTNVSVYFFPPPLGAHTGGDESITACDHPTDGVLIASGLTLNPGDPPLSFDSTDNAALAYVVQASDAGGELHADAGFTFFIAGATTDQQCDEKSVHNLVSCPEPCVEITKGLVPDSPTFSKVGDTVHYRICIHNCGTFDLTDVVVNDPLLGGDLAGFPDTLAPDQEVCLDFDYTVQQGDPDPLTNTVTVTGTDACDGETQATDSASFSVDLVQPGLSILKECDPHEASVGDDITYTITITNTGTVDLENITVGDSLLGDLSGSFPDSLAAGASDTEVFTRPIADTDPDPLVNTATVNATVVTLGNPLSAESSCSVSIIVVGEEGCTPGYWKNNTECWECYSTDTLFSAVFGGHVITIFNGGNPKQSSNYTTNPTLLQALGANGGGVNALARDAVAALLNACDEDIAYPLSVQGVIDAVNEALDAGADEIDSLHLLLDLYNNYGCPQDAHCNPIVLEDDVS
jgi:uncharacterized repeat protein (TIGR01451 family)